MNLLSPLQHRMVDYLTVGIFALAPTVLSLDGSAAILSYALAGVHLAMTLATRFRPAGGGPVPLPIHGWVELAVGVVLAVIGLLAPWSSAATTFYLVMGLVILSVRLVSSQHAVPSETRRPAAG